MYLLFGCDNCTVSGVGGISHSAVADGGVKAQNALFAVCQAFAFKVPENIQGIVIIIFRQEQLQSGVKHSLLLTVHKGCADNVLIVIRKVVGGGAVYAPVNGKAYLYEKPCQEHDRSAYQICFIGVSMIDEIEKYKYQTQHIGHSGACRCRGDIKPFQRREKFQ